ncbi:MAG: hypothetical protein EXS36_12955 [Pedosphaera sp.]|nr:hypothetical protein [Pedosphaera sp.]
MGNQLIANSGFRSGPMGAGKLPGRGDRRGRFNVPTVPISGSLLLLGLLFAQPSTVRSGDEGALIPVAATWLSGPLNFFASPAGLTFQEPIPYGVPNNLADGGWIWPNDNSGRLEIDFGAPTALGRVRVYSTYPGGPRGATWAIEHSTDKFNWIGSVDFAYTTKPGGGVNGDGSVRTDTAGWYELRLNPNSEEFQYWRVRQKAVTTSHAPRCGQMEFHLTPAPAAPPSLHLAWDGTRVAISWVDPTDKAMLQSADKITGDWQDVPRSFSPWILAPVETRKFYRLRK